MLRYSMFHSLATSLLPYILFPYISSNSIRWCTYKLNSQGFIIVLDGAFSVSYNIIHLRCGKYFLCGTFHVIYVYRMWSTYLLHTKI